MDRLKGLKCRECGRCYPSSPAHVCEFCFGPLEVDYDYEVIRAQVSRARIEAGPKSIWRYAPLLPVELGPDGEPHVGAAVGFTPLIRARNLGDELGVKELYVKNDSVCHPTWSFKDRVVAVAIGKAKEFGFDTVACASTGNLANSVAAHAAEARLKSYIFIPADLERGKVTATLVYAPTLIEVQGTYDEVNRLCAEVGDKYRWAFVNINIRPFYAEGSKTYGYEIAEQLGWRAPAHVVVPCAGGSLITKIAKAFKEMRLLGLIPEGKTSMYAAQAEGCGPIVTMIKKDTDVLTPVRAHRGDLHRDGRRRDRGRHEEADRDRADPAERVGGHLHHGQWAQDPGRAVRPAVERRHDPALPVGIRQGAGRPQIQDRGLTRRKEADMAVVVRIPTPLRSVTKGAAEVQAAGDTVDDVIQDLERQYPGLRERLVEDGGQIRRFINIYVNQEDIRFLEGAKTTLKQGDEVSIVPAIAGGR